MLENNRSGSGVDPGESVVTAVMVNYNAGEILFSAVSALLDSITPIHLVLVDNGSDRASWWPLKQRILELEGSLEIVENEDNKGFAFATNQGLGRATGDYLLLINPDCIVQPDTLLRMIAELERHPESGMAGCRILNKDGTEQRGCRRNLPTTGSGFNRAFNLQQFKRTKGIDLNEQSLPDRPVHVEAISGAFMLVRRAAYEQVGGLDESYFLHCEDLDWCKRFEEHGWRILFVPDVELTHYQGSCSRTEPVRVSWHKHRGMIRYYDSHLADQHSVLFSLFVRIGIYGRFLVLASWSAIKNLFSRNDR